jgi:hypothetical protein
VPEFAAVYAMALTLASFIAAISCLYLSSVSSLIYVACSFSDTLWERQR